MSSTIGSIFKITTYGESHGESIGVIIDGVPAGIYIDKDFIQEELNKRKPKNKFTTNRVEEDIFELHSGVFENYSTGTPIFLQIKNKEQNSRDYSNIKDVYRPSHADYTYDKKYGFRDYRGGGRSSGRETAMRVAGGAIAKLILNQLELNLDIFAYTNSIGNITVDNSSIDYNEIYNNDLRISNKKDYNKCINYLEDIKSEKDSVGGIIECIAKNVPIGLGEPIFDKLEANLSKAIMSIGSVKGIEFGLGFDISKEKGSFANDCFYSENGQTYKDTNNSGGTLGGISDGSDIIFRVAIKPTPSIGLTQSTINNNLENTDLTIKGRHDTVIVPRVASVIEAMTAITLVDALMLNMTCRMDNIRKIYK